VPGRRTLHPRTLRPLLDEGEEVSSEREYFERRLRDGDVELLPDPPREPDEARARAFAEMAGAHDWQALYGRLREVALLWEPEPRDRTVLRLGAVNPLQHGPASALHAMLAIAATDDEFAVRADGWQLRIVPKTLRGFLLMSCAADLGARQRFRRCDVCSEFFPVMRSDARFCTSACRQAAHAAKQEKR
jgi:hypothetical protein